MPTFDQLPCPALVTNRTGIVQSVNECLLELVGGVEDTWVAKPMELMLPIASRIFLQTHIWPMLMRENRVREIRLQIVDGAGKQVPVFVNSQKTTIDTRECFSWVFFVSVERSRFEQELIASKQRAETLTADLAKTERFIRTVTNAVPGMIGYWDTRMQCQFANNAYLDWFGRPPQQMIGLSITTFLGERLFEQNLPYIQGALAGTPQEFQLAIVKRDGTVGQVLANYIPDTNPNGQVQGFFVLVTDITRLKEAESAIQLSASVFNAATEGIMVTDAAAKIVSVNPAFTALTGYSSEEVAGQNARILISGRHDADFCETMFQELHAKKLWKGEVWSKRKDGSIYLQRLSMSAICDEAGEVTRFVGVFADITEEWNQQQRVQHMALHDGLTGLPNRSLLMERVAQLTATSARDPRHIAIMFLDLDGFKLVNDAWGHETGDLVLKTVSTRLVGLVRPSDTVTRFGGDEFVILLDNPDSRDNVAMIASRVIAKINAPMIFDGKVAHVGASVGIAFKAKDAAPVDDLLKNADAAMYEAKAAGKNTYRFSD